MTGTPIRCPGCAVELDEDDLDGQRRHLEAAHPEIIEERLVEHRRWDGWERDT
jgi:hypothetical protein